MSRHAHLCLLPLSVVPDGDEFLVGHQESGIFVAMPEEGVRLLRALQRGASVDEAAAILARQGLDVDADDFAAALVEAGLARVGGVASQNGTVLTAPRGWAQPFFSRPAWALYATALAYCAALLAIRPQYWPTARDFFFHGSPGISLAIMLSLGWCLTAVHELFHAAAAHAAGVCVRFRLGRRLFLPVLETDLTGLYSLPRRARYGPFLAGMAWDTLTLAISLTLRLLTDAGMLSLPWPKLPAAVALLALAQLGWQCLIFMRTDLYAVMVTLLGCRNLYRITHLHLRRRFGKLRAAEAAELAAASDRDVQTARWFGWLYLVGLVWAVFFLVAYYLPGLWFAGRWAAVTLVTGSASSPDFWLAAAVGLLAALQVLWPVILYVRREYPR